MLSWQVVSPLSIRFCDHFWPPACESCTRSLPQLSAKPSLRMPPGSRVVAVLSMTDSGVMASRCGGWVAPTNSCEMPGYEMPTMPTLLPSTHGWRATVSTAS